MPELPRTGPSKKHKEILEKYAGYPIKTFAYPNGQKNDYNKEVVNILKELGFEVALTTITGFNTVDTNPFELKRMSMDNTQSFSLFLSTVSGFRSFLQSLR